MGGLAAHRLLEQRHVAVGNVLDFVVGVPIHDLRLAHVLPHEPLGASRGLPDMIRGGDGIAGGWRIAVERHSRV